MFSGSAWIDVDPRLAGAGSALFSKVCRVLRGFFLEIVVGVAWVFPRGGGCLHPQALKVGAVHTTPGQCAKSWFPHEKHVL